MGIIVTMPNINISQNLAAWVIDAIQKHLLLNQSRVFMSALILRPVAS
jgi:hypothetical protein